MSYSYFCQKHTKGKILFTLHYNHFGCIRQVKRPSGIGSSVWDCLAKRFGQQSANDDRCGDRLPPAAQNHTRSAARARLCTAEWRRPETGHVTSIYPWGRPNAFTGATRNRGLTGGFRLLTKQCCYVAVLPSVWFSWIYLFAYFFCEKHSNFIVPKS